MPLSRRTRTSALQSMATSANRAPSGSDQLRCYRQYVGQYATAFVNNLLANPTLRATNGAFNQHEMNAILFDTGAPERTAFTTVQALALTLSPPMSVYPSIRIFPSAVSLATMGTPAFVADRVAEMVALLALRAVGDVRISIDAENYSGTEPSEDAIILAGSTAAAFRATWQPWVNTIVAANAHVTVYPMASNLSQRSGIHLVILMLLDALGVNNTTLGYYDGYGADDLRWSNPQGTWLGKQALFRATTERVNRIYGATTRQMFLIDNDIHRVWSNQILASKEADTLGYSIRSQEFDNTRGDRLQMGTPGWLTGTTIRSVNDVAYEWVTPPLNLDSVVSRGTAAQETLFGYRSTGANLSQGPSSTTLDLGGMRLGAGSPFIFSVMRSENAIPVGASSTWLARMLFQVPAALAAGDYPVMSQATYSNGQWQAYFKQDTSELWLQLAFGGTTSAYLIMSGVPRDTDIELYIGRSGLSWLHCTGAGAITRFATGSLVVHSISAINFGGGQTPATFPTDETLLSLPGLLLKRQSVWRDRICTDNEITGQLRGRTYPYGRGAATSILS